MSLVPRPLRDACGNGDETIKARGRMVDLSVRQELTSLVEELTHTGMQSLDEGKMKALKALCKCVRVRLARCL